MLRVRLLAGCRELCEDEEAGFTPQLIYTMRLDLLGLNTVPDVIHVFKKLTFKYSGHVMAANTNNGKCYEMIVELGERSRVPSTGENPGGLH